ncbi:hypothetical protein E2C01_050681 [Portunus trituberculatus]|uniref:Uncharacterized protein n=1 Tax=Portunus trituberculatus TaxID=210409 RepID=A0A5B7GHN6_PORTR|nr:hypothetical protein [Portunus trituberculatus]
MWRGVAWRGAAEPSNGGLARGEFMKRETLLRTQLITSVAFENTYDESEAFQKACVILTHFEIESVSWA